MSTFVRKAEEAITSKQPERDSSPHHGSHNSDSDPGNKADTEVISDRGMIAIYPSIIVAKKLTCLENHGANFSRFVGDKHLDSVRHYGSNDATGPHGSKVANKLDPRVDSSKEANARQQASNGNIPGWMIA